VIAGGGGTSGRGKKIKRPTERRFGHKLGRRQSRPEKPAQEKKKWVAQKRRPEEHDRSREKKTPLLVAKKPKEEQKHHRWE